MVFLKTFIMLLIRDQPIKNFYNISYPDLMNFQTVKRNINLIELPNSLKAGYRTREYWNGKYGIGTKPLI